jgi:hypothetical protein
MRNIAGIVTALLLWAMPAVALEIGAFGGRPDGSNTTPAWNAAIAAAVAGSDKTIHFPAGDYTFSTPPGPLSGSVRIVGEGQMNTVLHRAYQGNPSTDCGLGGMPASAACDFIVIRGKGSSLRDLTILADSRTAGGTGLHIVADAADAGGYHDIRNVWITGGASPRTGLSDASGTYLIPLFLDGTQRPSGPLEGLRVVYLDNVTVWQGTWWAVDWWNCVACEWIGGGVYQGGGTTQNVSVGGPISQRNYLNANIQGTVTGSGYTVAR